MRHLALVGAKPKLLDGREDHFAAASGEQVAQLVDALRVLDIAYEPTNGDELIEELVVQVGAIDLDDERRVFQRRMPA